MTAPVEDWTVYDTYGQTRTFTQPGAACAFAVRDARADKPTIVVAPDGQRSLVLRIDPAVEVQLVRRLTGTGWPT